MPGKLPLVGGDGLLPDGYPMAHIDGAAMRSVLWHHDYATLDRYFTELQDDFEADNKREFWIGAAADAFGSGEPALGARLDAWVAATPDSFAPYLARGDYWAAVGWAGRGGKWSKDTPQADMDAMREAFARAIADLDHALSIRPTLVHARLLRIGILGSRGDLAAMRREVDSATHTCPGCSRVRIVYLLHTTPRSGGSYDAMRAYAATCDARINLRCRLLPGLIDFDKADLAWIAERLPEAEEAIDRERRCASTTSPPISCRSTARSRGTAPAPSSARTTTPTSRRSRPRPPQNPDDLRVHQKLDYALSQRRDFARIADMWTEYIGRHPDDARAHMERRDVPSARADARGERRRAPRVRARDQRGLRASAVAEGRAVTARAAPPRSPR